MRHRSRLNTGDAFFVFDHRPAGWLQPHWQFRSRQLHAFLGQPQEQVPQSQAVAAALFWLAFWFN